jgi:hypothetical protein
MEMTEFLKLAVTVGMLCVVAQTVYFIVSGR